MYQYWGYGLLIESEIEFPELLPFTYEKAQVSIMLGKTPENLEGADVLRRVRVQISPKEYLLNVPNIANYYVHSGNTVTVEALPNADDKSIRLFLLSNAMAAIVYQRGMIPLHASAIEINGGLVLFCGESGAGKSTTVSALKQWGYKIFSDDVCVLRYTADGSIEAFSSYPMVKLWEDSYQKLNLDAENHSDGKLRPELPKYANYFHPEFNTHAKTVKSIFVLQKQKAATEVSLQKLDNLKAFATVQNQTYRNLQLNAMGKRTDHFLMINKLITQAETFSITRPEFTNSLEQVTSVIDLKIKSR